MLAAGMAGEWADEMLTERVGHAEGERRLLHDLAGERDVARILLDRRLKVLDAAVQRDLGGDARLDLPNRIVIAFLRPNGAGARQKTNRHQRNRAHTAD